MKSENILIKNYGNDELINFLKKYKVAILGMTAVLLAGIIYIMAFHEKAEEKRIDLMSTGACVQTTGCTSNSCINHKQFRYNSSGLKQCCKC